MFAQFLTSQAGVIAAVRRGGTTVKVGNLPGGEVPVALGGIVTGLGIYIWRTGYTTVPAAARRKDETAAPEHSEYEDSTSLEF